MDCDTPEPTELVLDVEENVPSTGIGVLEQSNVEDNGDQVASALESDDMDVIDAILGDIVTAIESYHQVDDPVDDLSVLVEPCSGEPNISIPPSESTELLPAGAIDELAEAVVEAADEALTPEAHADQVVEDVSQSDSIETEADSSQLFVETEDVAVAQAVGDLVDAVADCSNATPTVDSVDEPDFDGEDIKTQCREDEASTEQDTASQDTFESVADSSYDLAVQSGERRVLSDLCTSVERRYAPRHGGRARSVHFAGGTKDESFDRQKHMRRSVLLWEAPVDSASTKESVESAAKRRASKRRVSRRTLADLLAFPTELARFTSSDTTLLAYDARLEQGPIFSLLDQSILTINPDGRHIHLDDQDERLGSSKMIGKRRTLTQELHSKNLARRQIPRFNYMPMSIKFQWSDFVVATPVRPSNISFGEGHNAKSPQSSPCASSRRKGPNCRVAATSSSRPSFGRSKTATRTCGCRFTTPSAWRSSSSTSRRISRRNTTSSPRVWRRSRSSSSVTWNSDAMRTRSSSNCPRRRLQRGARRIPIDFKVSARWSARGSPEEGAAVETEPDERVPPETPCVFACSDELSRLERILGRTDLGRKCGRK